MSAGFRSIRPRVALGWVPLALMLSACAGSPWGERLAESFPPATETTPQPNTSTPAAAPSITATNATSAGSTSSRSTPNSSLPPGQPFPPAAPPVARAKPAASKPGPATPSSKTANPTASTNPQPTAPAPGAGPLVGGRSSAPSPLPYRVTLRLPRADPSAPAEAVTQALRAAGIAFEVETIERVPSGAAAPTVRPAPPPR
ncbi:MAG: hypothetical protein FJ083_00030 [Cyanobacteria bacterium K_Offshore_surface_m2_239]|nr:hypothetical protein [Cyanobacteria bacterium K_Offshore_surface_m2_239]